MNILIFNKQKDLPISRKATKALVSAVLSHEKQQGGEISIYFVSEKIICQMHNEFFQDPSPTDCISFPLENTPLSGEIFVCPHTAVHYAKKRELDPHQETALYLVHGLLHLLGYDDLEPLQRRVMRKKEKSCMRELNNLNISLRPA
ncbi:MAG: rRNA maturation RNase YbeY [Chlamydiales bacterium]|nr:rRNA maturation RNase YbeY [Chlamydiales bacterium]